MTKSECRRNDEFTSPKGSRGLTWTSQPNEFWHSEFGLLSSFGIRAAPDPAFPLPSPRQDNGDLMTAFDRWIGYIAAISVLLWPLCLVVAFIADAFCEARTEESWIRISGYMLFPSYMFGFWGYYGLRDGPVHHWCDTRFARKWSKWRIQLTPARQRFFGIILLVDSVVLFVWAIEIFVNC